MKMLGRGRLAGRSGDVDDWLGLGSSRSIRVLSGRILGFGESAGSRSRNMTNRLRLRSNRSIRLSSDRETCILRSHGYVDGNKEGPDYLGPRRSVFCKHGTRPLCRSLSISGISSMMFALLIGVLGGVARGVCRPHNRIGSIGKD